MKERKKVILASQSPRRKELLKQIGVSFVCMPSDVEESITSDNPEEVVKALSRQKAEDIAGRLNLKEENALVIGADTVVAYGGKILGKPQDERQAKEMLSMLQGNRHQVYTGVTLIWDERQIAFACCTQVSMYPMTEKQIEAYVATKEPLDKAGAYAIQGRCAAYIEKIEGDYNNVVGLPAAAVIQSLLSYGIELI